MAPDCGIGGKDSNKEAPNEEVGLKGFKPEKPVVWGWSDGTEEALEAVIEENAEENVEVAVLAPVG